jgi:hypothetical protein
MKSILRTLPALLALAFLLNSCGGGGSSFVDPLNSSGSLEILVSKESVPEFAWIEGTLIQSITVHSLFNGTTNQMLWGYSNIARDSLVVISGAESLVVYGALSPVVYGVTLPGVKLTAGDASLLQRGVRYRVTVVSSGEESFTEWQVP